MDFVEFSSSSLFKWYKCSSSSVVCRMGEVYLEWVRIVLVGVMEVF